MNRTIGIAVIATALGLGLIFPPTARADQFDYVSVLDSNGVYYTSMADVIDLGKQLCRIGRSAPTDQAMASGMSSALRSNGISSPAEIQIVVSAAVEHMCPDVWPRIRGMASTVN